MMMRLEQELEEWMVDLMSEFYKEGELMIGTCAGTLMTAKTCL